MLTLSLLLIAACSEPPFARTNPIDPLHEGTLTLSGGPDTIRTTGDNYTLVLTGDPEIDPTKYVRWTSNHARLLTGGGAIYWAYPTLMPTTAIARATMGSKVAERTFVLLQEVGTISATCTATSPCDTVDAFGPFEFDIGGVDTFGWPLLDIPYAIGAGNVGPRNPALFEPAPSGVAGRVRYVARSNGATWLLLGIGGYLDSVKVVVAQRAVSWTNQCPATVDVGETVPLRASFFIDRLGQPLEAGYPPPEITWAAGGASDPGAEAVVDPAGSITGVAPGRWLTSSSAPGIGPPHVCLIEVVDP